MLESKTKVENLMNLVMQLRKVCNHPELFQRRQSQSPFVFTDMIPVVEKKIAPRSRKEVDCYNQNPISLNYPRFLINELADLRDEKK